MTGASDSDRRRLTRRLDPRLVTAVLALAGMSASFMQTLVIPIQPELPALLSASKDDTTWVVTVTLLSAAVLTPISGRLGDLFGKRRVLLALLVIMVVGSLICAFSSTLVPIIVGRALQGAAIGIIPLGISILRDVLHPDRLGGAIALVSATLGVGGAIGLPISAIVVQNFDWHAIFWLSVVLGSLVFALVWYLVPPSTLRTSGRFDLVGAIGLAIALSGILLGVSKGNDWGWTSPGILGLLIGGLVVLGLWGWFERRTASPLVDLRVAARKPVLLTNLASVALGFALFGSNVALPQLLELPTATGVGLGQSVLVSSLVLMPSGLVMMVMSPLSARLSRRFGPRLLLVAGSVLIVISYVIVLFLSTEVWHILLVAVVIGLGIGLGYAAMPTLIMHAVPATETAAANGLNTLMRSLGTTIASAVIGAVLASFVVSSGGFLVPTVVGFRIAFLCGAGAALAAAVLAYLVPRSERGYEARPSLPE